VTLAAPVAVGVGSAGDRGPYSDSDDDRDNSKIAFSGAKSLFLNTLTIVPPIPFRLCAALPSDSDLTR
jgi:hypothetical protein